MFVGVFKEVGDADTKNLRHHIQASGADPIDTLLVLLDLLKRESKRSPQLLLRHSDGHPSEAKTRPHMRVDTGRVTSFHGAVTR